MNEPEPRSGVDAHAAVANAITVAMLAFAIMWAIPGAGEPWTFWRAVRVAVGLPLLLWVSRMFLGALALRR